MIYVTYTIYTIIMRHIFIDMLQWFFNSKVLECPVKKFLETNHKKSVLVPEEGIFSLILKRLTKVPFINYGDCFECVLMPLTDEIHFCPSTKKYQYHIVCSYGYVTN